jgi:hypothetical protein
MIRNEFGGSCGPRPGAAAPTPPEEHEGPRGAEERQGAAEGRHPPHERVRLDLAILPPAHREVAETGLHVAREEHERRDADGRLVEQLAVGEVEGVRGIRPHAAPLRLAPPDADHHVVLGRPTGEPGRVAHVQADLDVPAPRRARLPSLPREGGRVEGRAQGAIDALAHHGAHGPGGVTFERHGDARVVDAELDAGEVVRDDRPVTEGVSETGREEHREERPEGARRPPHPGARLQVAEPTTPPSTRIV